MLEPRGPDQLRFTHDKVRETIYDQIPPDRRRALHAAAARVIEARSLDGRWVGHRSIAFHWREAGEPRRAIDHLERAAEQARLTSSSREAIAVLEECFALAGQLAEPVGRLREVRWLRQVADVRLDLGEDALALPIVASALAGLGELPVPVDDRAARFPTLLQAGLRLVQGPLRALFRVGGEAQVAAAEAAHLYGRLVEPALARGLPLVALFCGLRSLNLAGRFPPGPALARTWASLAVLAAGGPLAPLARAWATRGLRQAEALGSASARLHALFRAGLVHHLLGELREAELRLRRCVELGAAVGDVRAGDEAVLVLVDGALAVGALDEVVQRAREVLGAAELRGDRALRGRAAAGLVEALARLGRFEEARLVGMRMDPDAATLAEVDAYRFQVAWGTARRLMGDAGGARGALNRARAAARRRPPVGLVANAAAAESESWFALWEAARETGGDPEAWRSAQEAVETLERAARAERVARASAALWAGTLASARGDARTARRSWARAVRWAEQDGQPLVLARALVEGAHAQEGSARIDALRRAVGLFEAAGADPERRRAQRLLEGR